jgi:hypothetical protein
MVPDGHGVLPAPDPPTVVAVLAPGEVPGIAVVLEPGVVVAAPGEVPGIAVVFMPGVTPGVVVCGTATPPVVGAVEVRGAVVVWPAVAGAMPGDVAVWPAVAGAPAAVPPVVAVPAVCAYTHVPASSNVKKSIFRMQNSSAVETDGSSVDLNLSEFDGTGRDDDVRGLRQLSISDLLAVTRSSCSG